MQVLQTKSIPHHSSCNVSMCESRDGRGQEAVRRAYEEEGDQKSSCRHFRWRQLPARVEKSRLQASGVCFSLPLCCLGVSSHLLSLSNPCRMLNVDQTIRLDLRWRPAVLKRRDQTNAERVRDGHGNPCCVCVLCMHVDTLTPKAADQN